MKKQKSNLNPTSLADRICDAMFHNAGLFLRKAAEEIAGHARASADPFNADRATLVTVLTQVAVELACTAMIILHEGLAGVVAPRDLPANDVETEERWKAGTLRTLTFEILKPKAAQYLGDEDFWSVVDFLQLKRNKLVHFHAPIMKGDRFDLKYDATHVLIQIIAALTKAELDEFALGCSVFLGQELFHQLVSFEPYRDRISARAREIELQPLTCGACDARAFLRDKEICLCCGYSGAVKLHKCLQCKDQAVFYDYLNLPENDSLKARCGHCGWEGRAAHCAVCENDYLFESHGLSICRWCEED